MFGLNLVRSHLSWGHRVMIFLVESAVAMEVTSTSKTPKLKSFTLVPLVMDLNLAEVSNLDYY